MKEVQNSVVTALSASGLTMADACKDGAAMAAASKHAAHEAALGEIATRLTSIETRQQEANVTLRKAEALLSGPAAGLAAMNAASAAAAASAATSRKDTRLEQELVEDLTKR